MTGDRDRPQPQRPGQEPAGPVGSDGGASDPARPRSQRPGQEPARPPGQHDETASPARRAARPAAAPADPPAGREGPAPERNRPERPPAGALGGRRGASPREGSRTAGDDSAAGVEWQVRRVLVALDASPASRAAATTAARLAAHLRTELAGIFVQDTTLARLVGWSGAAEVGSFSATSRPLADAELRRRLRGQASRARRLFEATAARAAVEGTFRVVHGTVSRELCAACTEADLLSLGRVGTSGAARLGSVARAALADSRGPLLLLPPRGRLSGPVLAVYGGGDEGRRTLAAAAGLARALGRRPSGGPGEGQGEGQGGREEARRGRGRDRSRSDHGRDPSLRTTGADWVKSYGPGFTGASTGRPTGGSSGPAADLVVLVAPQAQGDAAAEADPAAQEAAARSLLGDLGAEARFHHPDPTHRPSRAGHPLAHAVATVRAHALVLPTNSPLAARDELETVVEALDCAILLVR